LTFNQMEVMMAPNLLCRVYKKHDETTCLWHDKVTVLTSS